MIRMSLYYMIPTAMSTEIHNCVRRVSFVGEHVSFLSEHFFALVSLMMTIRAFSMTSLSKSRKTPSGGFLFLVELWTKPQLTFCFETGRIILIHYVPIWKIYGRAIMYLGGNHIEGLGMFNYCRGDGSSYQCSAGKRQKGWR